MHFLNEYFSILVLFFFLEFVLVAFLSYRWFGVDNLIDESEVKDKHIEDLCARIGDMNVHIDILEKFFVEEVTHMCVVDAQENIKFVVSVKDPFYMGQCVKTIDSYARHESTRGNLYLIKPMILFSKIDEIEYLLRSKELKEKGALQNGTTEDRFE